jgi:hypothetical protein
MKSWAHYPTMNQVFSFNPAGWKRTGMVGVFADQTFETSGTRLTENTNAHGCFFVKK